MGRLVLLLLLRGSLPDAFLLVILLLLFVLVVEAFLGVALGFVGGVARRGEVLLGLPVLGVVRARLGDRVVDLRRLARLRRLELVVGLRRRRRA